MRRDQSGRVIASVSSGGAPRSPEGAPDSLRRQIDAVTGSVRSWLLTGSRRIPIDPRRKQGVHEGLKLILTEDEESVDSIGQEISESMKRHAVVEAMNRLPAAESQIVKLAYFGGKTNEEIASSTGLPVHSVRRRLREGLRQMQANLESTGLVDMARGSGGRRGLAGFAAWLLDRALPSRGLRRSAAQELGVAENPNLLQALAGPAAASVVVGIATATVAVAAATGHLGHLSSSALAGASLPQLAAGHQVHHPGKPAASVQALAGSVDASTLSGSADTGQAGSADRAGSWAAGHGPIHHAVAGLLPALPATPHGAVGSVTAVAGGPAVSPPVTGSVTVAVQNAASAVVTTSQGVLPKLP